MSDPFLEQVQGFMERVAPRKGSKDAMKKKSSKKAKPRLGSGEALRAQAGCEPQERLSA